MVRGVRVGVSGIPSSGMTGGTVATSTEGLAIRAVDRNAIRIVTAGATVVSVQSATVQGVVMTASTSAAGDGDQCSVDWGVGGVEVLPGTVWIREGDVTGCTITAVSRYGRLQR